MKNAIRLSFLGCIAGTIIGTIAGGMMIGIDPRRIGERVYFQVLSLLVTWAVIEFNT